MKNCDQFREMYEAYALGALDPAELAALEAHLATGCQDCAKSVDEARWLVSQLAYMAPEAGPSDMLKGRLVQTVRAETRITKASASPERVIPVWVWAGVAAALVFTMYSAWESQNLRNQIRKLDQQTAAAVEQRKQLETQLYVADLERKILTDPVSVTITLSAQNSQLPSLAGKWHAQLGVVLIGQNIPLPPGDRVLELWLIPKAPGAKPMPLIKLRPDADGQFVALAPILPLALEDTKALAITEEPAEGSLQPTTTPRWVGGVS